MPHEPRQCLVDGARYQEGIDELGRRRSSPGEDRNHWPPPVLTDGVGRSDRPARAAALEPSNPASVSATITCVRGFAGVGDGGTRRGFHGSRGLRCAASRHRRRTATDLGQRRRAQLWWAQPSRQRPIRRSRVVLQAARRRRNRAATSPACLSTSGPSLSSSSAASGRRRRRGPCGSRLVEDNANHVGDVFAPHLPTSHFTGRSKLAQSSVDGVIAASCGRPDRLRVDAWVDAASRDEEPSG